MARVTTNLAELDRHLEKQPIIQRLKVEGGWYAVLRVPAVQPDETTTLELLDRGLWVHPGYFFGMEPAGWLVVSLLGPQAEFQSGVTTLVNYYAKHQKSNSASV
jgi:bifunctional pyridoxal-dependent enzyme with beta-cystathionase and maltose regulon repressor activities